MKILIVEDNQGEMKLMQHVLSAAGHGVKGVEMAEDAIAAIEVDTPHLILLDLALPGMDGLALARALRSAAKSRDIRIVAVTSFPERYSKLSALAAGCDAYLLKPLSTRDLSNQIDAVTRMSS